MPLKVKSQAPSERTIEEAGAQERTPDSEDAYLRRLFPVTAIFLIVLAIDCASRGEWTGVNASVLGAVQAMLARHYYLKWKRT